MIQTLKKTRSMSKQESAYVISRKVDYADNKGRRIKGYIDKASNNGKSKHFVIISPGYAETKRDYISTAYYLAINGFTVLRYDCPNHLGESEGDITNFVLSDMEDGLRSSIDFIVKKYSPKNIGLISSSVSGRVAFRIAGEDKRIGYLISLTSVVNLAATITAAYKEDLITEYNNGRRWGTIDMLGFEIKDEFLGLAIDGKYADLRSTMMDIEKIRVPVCFVAAENDVWVNHNDVRSVYKKSINRKSKFISIPHALHQIQENPRLAYYAILKIVESCIQYINGETTKKELKKPDIHDIVVQNKKEMVNLRCIFSVTKSEEKHFWVDYLSKYYVLIKSNDYQNFLSLIAQLFGNIKNGDRILDAGCGNGHFGSWLLCNMENKSASRQMCNAFSYTGLDFAENAIKEAKEIHFGILRRLYASDKGNNIDFKYVIADLDGTIPFPNNSFDKICCNLVISYLRNHETVLLKLYYKLKAGGKIVVSSLKPYNDLSLIYKNYLDQNLNVEDIIEGRKLLSSAGKIRHKEKQGHYHFFNEDELIDLISKAGFIKAHVYRSFGNQANVIVAEK